VVGIKLLEQGLDFLSDLLAGRVVIRILAGGITQADRDLSQPAMGLLKVVCQGAIFGQDNIHLLDDFSEIPALGILLRQLT
jgi:hypothetical protein